MASPEALKATVVAAIHARAGEIAAISEEVMRLPRAGFARPAPPDSWRTGSARSACAAPRAWQ